MALTDEELLSFALDGTSLPSEKKTHLDKCATCQGRLSEYRQVNSALTSHLYRSQCPDGTQLSLYCASLLPSVQRTRIAAHILDCPLCATEVAETRRFMREVEPVPPPAFSLGTTVRRIVATLVRQQAQLVLRSGNEPSITGWPRQYRAESIDLSLHLSRASNGEAVLLGILTSIDNAESVDAFEGTRAELYNAPFEGNGEQTPLRSTKVDELGSLVFGAVPAGNYELAIHLPENDIIIEGLTIESS